MASVPAAAAGTQPLVRIENLNHSFGRGKLAKQILYDISEAVWPGEILILTGPSGSGKTTLLTLIGALRAAQDGSLVVLGNELRNASENALTEVRRGIGYIFQSHNLLDALTATQNVEVALLEGGIDRDESRKRALSMLEAVGLADRAAHYPRQLSGGQKQRVAIARALASSPRLILADEPTASLDKKSGREVVEIMQRLTKQEGCAVVLVTHDNRILDIADRVIHLEDGRLASFAASVADATQKLIRSYSRTTTNDHVIERIESANTEEFSEALQTLTQESQDLLQVLELTSDETFGALFERVLRALTIRIGEFLDAERCSLWLVDEEKNRICAQVAFDEAGNPLQIEVPLGEGIVGHVAATGEVVNVPDAYADDRFNADVDRRTGFQTRNILCMPLRRSDGSVFGVTQLLNRRADGPFDQADEKRFDELAASLAIVLETWWAMRGSRRRT